MWKRAPQSFTLLRLHLLKTRSFELRDPESESRDNVSTATELLYKSLVAQTACWLTYRPSTSPHPLSVTGVCPLFSLIGFSLFPQSLPKASVRWSRPVQVRTCDRAAGCWPILLTLKCQLIVIYIITTYFYWLSQNILIIFTRQAVLNDFIKLISI